jgi:hypothetical protein
MSLLAEAIRHSDTETARYEAADGTRVIVQRITGREMQDNQEEYLVRTKRLGGLPHSRIAALDLVEALEYMRNLGIPDFNPDTADWQPARGEGAEDNPPDREMDEWTQA